MSTDSIASQLKSPTSNAYCARSGYPAALVTVAKTKEPATVGR